MTAVASEQKSSRQESGNTNSTLSANPSATCNRPSDSDALLPVAKNGDLKLTPYEIHLVPRHILNSLFSHAQTLQSLGNTVLKEQQLTRYTHMFCFIDIFR